MKVPGFKPRETDKFEILKHADFIEYLANKNIHVVEKRDAKGEKFLHLSKPLAENLKKEIDAVNTDISTIATFKENRQMALNILKELTAVLPKTSWLTRVRITETNVEIEGYAGSATELLPKLEASPLFKKAEFASPTFRDARMNSDRFIIKMEIEGIKKAEGTTAKNGKK